MPRWCLDHRYALPEILLEEIVDQSDRCVDIRNDQECCLPSERGSYIGMELDRRGVYLRSGAAPDCRSQNQGSTTGMRGNRVLPLQQAN